MSEHYSYLLPSYVYVIYTVLIFQKCPQNKEKSRNDGDVAAEGKRRLKFVAGYGSAKQSTPRAREGAIRAAEFLAFSLRPKDMSICGRML